MGTEDGMSNCDVADCAEGVQCLKSEALSNGVEVVDGNDVAEEAQRFKSEVFSNEVVIADGNDVVEEAQNLKNEATDNGVAIADGNGVTEEAWCLESEAINNGVSIANGNVITEEAPHLKHEASCNGAAIADGFGSVDRESGGFECFQTYKRRKHGKSSSESKVHEEFRGCVESASHPADQDVKEPCNAALGNSSDDYSHGHWGNVVLKRIYQSLGDGNGGLEGCIKEALMHHPKISSSSRVMEAFKTDKDGQECSSQLELVSHRAQSEANGHVDITHNGCSSKPHDHGVTKLCQRVLCNVLTSEKFSSLCKALLENFQGMKPESVFDFSVMNSRMKEQAYEQSPALFLSDIQQIWRKLQDTGNEIVALAKSLSNLSRTSYCELVGISAQSTFEDEKQLFYNQASGTHIKPEQAEECARHKICCCRRCGDKADGTDCLVCDSCEEIYHVSCIMPAMKEIPQKSWYCGNCTASGIGSPHHNCVVCEKLNEVKTLSNIVGDESFHTNEEALNEPEENSYCTDDGIQASIGGKSSPNCKMCGNDVVGEKVKICGHPFCPSKYYHVRCLTRKQLKSYSHCWYCPSCLCRVCFTDQDDDQIILCDGCDHAYHIYCMKPPRTSIPRGKWFCRKCDAGIQAIWRAKKAYESNKWRRTGDDVSKPSANLEKKCNNKHVRELDKGGGMDMLLTAANTLNFEEKMAAFQTELRRA